MCRPESLLVELLRLRHVYRVIPVNYVIHVGMPLNETTIFHIDPVNTIYPFFIKEKIEGPINRYFSSAKQAYDFSPDYQTSQI